MKTQALNLGPPIGELQEFNEATQQWERVIYQRTGKQFANSASARFPTLQRRTEPGGTKGSTPGQVRSRQTLAAAVQDWHAMSQEERKAWNDRGRNLEHPLPGYQAFVRHRLRESAAIPQ